MESTSPEQPMKSEMFELLQRYMSKYPRNRLLRRSIVKKAFLRSKRGRLGVCSQRVKLLRQGKSNPSSEVLPRDQLRSEARRVQMSYLLRVLYQA